MNIVKKYIASIMLFICGAILLAIGLSITLSPVGFYAASGIALDSNSSLISELRAPAGMLIAIGIIILISLRVSVIKPYAWFLSSLVYFPYGIARLIGFAVDGMPHQSIVFAALIELVLGMISISMLMHTGIISRKTCSTSSQYLMEKCDSESAITIK